jgi:hypothetical protein
LGQLVLVDVEGQKKAAAPAVQVFVAAADEERVELTGMALEDRDQRRRRRRHQAQGNVVRMKAIEMGAIVRDSLLG